MVLSDVSHSAGRLKLTLYFFGITAAVWLLLGFFGAFSTALVLFAAFTAIVWIPLYLLVFGCLWWAEGIAPAEPPTRVRNRILLGIAPPVLLAAAVLAALPLIWAASYLGDLTRLALNDEAYARIVAQARDDGVKKWYETSAGGITYSVDAGPPVRVAFNPEGMLDNWGAIVFDPTGEMTQADGFDPETGEFHAPDRITKLFGGDLVGCRRLWGDYYTCSWT